MTIGIIIRGCNAIFEKKPLDFFFEFLPMLVFLSCTFGYMCILIIIKWNIDYIEDTSAAPSILTMMLNFGLYLGSTEGEALYEG